MSIRRVLRPLAVFEAKHLALLRQLAAIQHQLLDQSTVLGFLWSFLNPVLMLGVLWMYFGRQAGQQVPHYALYLLVGLVQFTHFSKSIVTAMHSLTNMRGLATSVIFPKDILVYSALAASLPEFFISVVLTLLIAQGAGAPLTMALVALPLAVLAHLLLVLWLSLSLAMLYVVLRDLDHLFEVGVRLLFFVTPIFYSVDTLTPGLRTLTRLNPLAHAIEYTRAILIGDHVLDASALVVFCLWQLALCYAAVATFRTLEPALVERL